MDRGFFKRKIDELTDDKLMDVLQKTGGNVELYGLAKEEAERRGLMSRPVEQSHGGDLTTKPEDEQKLREWNWGAFLLAPIWALANGLDKWAILCFVPIVNIVVVFYLGYNGNRMAFDKSEIESVDDFMIFQRNWEMWGVRLFWFGLFVGVFFVIF